MIRALFVHLKSLLIVAVFLAGLSVIDARAGVETYVDDAVPPSSGTAEGQPLNPGDLTMQDVLRNLPPPKKQLPLPASGNPVLLTPPVVAASTPQLKTPSPQTSSTGAMLMQGMQSALGQAGVNTTPTLQAPQMPSDRAATTARQTTPVAAGISAAPLPNIGASSPASVPAATSAPGVTANGTCTPQVSSWVKTCAEAGYPANHTGDIHGETRTTCPEGSLQDVWMSNGCVPPEGGEAGAAPISTSAPATLTSPSSTTLAVTPSGEEVVVGADGRADGACGVANGMASNARPLYDLCVSGRSTPLVGNGPWRWNCQGIGGGMTVSCAAPLAAGSVAAVSAASNPATGTTAASADTSTPPTPGLEDALCGTADGVVADSAPISGLCAKGASSRVNGSGPWTWACSGTNGGRAAACSAPKKIDGLCGGANGAGMDTMPMADLCVAGYASAVTGNGPWAWTCSGLNGGQAATCSAAPKLNAVCGPASLNGRGDMPKNALCSVGQPSAVNGAGPWSWTCQGTNGGASVPCEARLSVNGVCGLAHGTSVGEIPGDNLCANGKASRVTGDGPWNWTCMGLDGGDTASCTAMRASDRVPVPVPAVAPPPKAARAAKAAPAVAETAAADTANAVNSKVNMCGSAAEMVAIEAPTKNLCKSGSASDVSGRGPWVWTCADGNGQQSSCATLSLESSGDQSSAPAQPAPAMAAPVAEPQSAACGNAAGQGVTTEPVDNLCAVGKAGSVKGSGPWTWTCIKGKSRASCEAPKIADGACGMANGSVQVAAPADGLCNSGTPTQIQGNGPWLWSCVGSGGGSSISCSAASQAQTRVNGTCGAASNAAVSATPAANLCDSGVASAVYGEGPWTWTCSGLNGGIAASCSAQKNTPPAPPPPGPVVNGLCGSANGVAMIVEPLDNLCSTGDATAVSGNGPWNWNCLGENSGMTVSCTAPLQPPAPISGVCGMSNGVPTLTTPRSGLCSGGIASAVSGKGPWTWSCSGVNGGGAVGCVAPLAGSEVGSLPSMTTPGDMGAAPYAAPTGPVSRHGLVTPRLPSGSLPALQTGSLPPPPPMDSGMSAPAEVPQLPDDSQGVPPPPVRDTIQPSPALKADESGAVLPGNHFVLDSDISVLPFTHGSENFDPSIVPTLDKLAAVLNDHGGVRITLTAYADSAGTTPREARRISLSRALAIRDYLTSKGISSARIDVRALGANVPSGEPDRIDVKAN